MTYRLIEKLHQKLSKSEKNMLELTTEEIQTMLRDIVDELCYRPQELVVEILSKHELHEQIDYFANLVLKKIRGKELWVNKIM